MKGLAGGNGHNGINDENMIGQPAGGAKGHSKKAECSFQEEAARDESVG